MGVGAGSASASLAAHLARAGEGLNIDRQTLHWPCASVAWGRARTHSTRAQCFTGRALLHSDVMPCKDTRAAHGALWDGFGMLRTYHWAFVFSHFKR
eukprot:949648-Pyramimonas_sp.AAC.1